MKKLLLFFLLLTINSSLWAFQQEPISQNARKSINEKGVKRNEDGNPSTSGISQGKSINEKGVKRNEDVNPSTSGIPQGKSINEKGFKRNEDVNPSTSRVQQRKNPYNNPLTHGWKDNLKTEVILTLGGGFSNPSSRFKNANNAGNFSQFNANAFVPVFQYGGATGGVINLGFNAGLEYFSANKDYDLSLYKPYNISGQSSVPTTTAKGSGGPKQAGFKTEAGVQANFNFGNFSISPILNAAYISLKQKSFDVTQTSSVNGQTKDFSLYSQSETKTNGIAIVPKVRLGYQLGATSNFGIFVEAAYLFGPSVTTESKVFLPNGNPNAQGNYFIDQMLTGKSVAQTQKSNFNLFSVNFGLSYAIRGHVKNNLQSSDIADGQNAKTDGGKVNIQDFTLMKKNPAGRAVAPTRVKCNCGKDIYGKDEAACRRICRFLKDGTYINGKAIFTPQELQDIKDDYIDGLFVTTNGIEELNPKLFKEIRTTKDEVGQKVSIKNIATKKRYAFLGNQDELVKIISIPSARVQECADCNEADNCDNSGHYDCCCNHGYCWCLMCIIKSTLTPLPEEKIIDNGGGTNTDQPSTDVNKSITQKGGKRNAQSSDNVVGQGASLLGGVMPDSSKNIGNTSTTKSESGTTSSSYAAGKQIPQNHNQEKGITEKGIKRGALNYKEDYYVQDDATLKFLHTNELVIKKGFYKADYSSNPFGTITLLLSKPIDAKSINEKGVKRMAASGYHCDRDCKEEADVCWTCKTKSSAALLYHYELEPIIEQGIITKLKIINKKVSLNNVELTAKQYQELTEK